jgi:hypothetical protein
LVDLIRPHAHAGKSKHRHGRRRRHRVQGHRQQRRQHRQRNQCHVAIAVSEATPRQIVGIDVMQAERHQQALSDDGKIVVSPGIRGPVNESRGEIGGGHAREQCGDGPPFEADVESQARAGERRRGAGGRDGGHPRDALRARGLDHS